MKEYDKVLQFWFDRKDMKVLFKKDKKFDSLIKKKFETLIREAKRGSLSEWEKSPESSLALILLLDQFTRNIYRDKPEAFEADGLSQKIATEAVKKKFDQKLPKSRRWFFYMPFMHAENLAMQRRCVRLMAATGSEASLKFAKMHEGLIREYGRFPHRNKILGRKSTPKEKKYLATPGAGF